MNNEEKILAILAQMQADMVGIKADITDVKATQAAQGEQLAAHGAQLAALTDKVEGMDKRLSEQGERLRKIETRIENNIVPDIKLLAEGHQTLLETLAHKDVAERAVATANFALSAVKANTQEIKSLSARVEKLEKAN